MSFSSEPQTTPSSIFKDLRKILNPEKKDVYKRQSQIKKHKTKYSGISQTGFSDEPKFCTT